MRKPVSLSNAHKFWLSRLRRLLQSFEFAWFDMLKHENLWRVECQEAKRQQVVRLGWCLWVCVARLTTARYTQSLREYKMYTSASRCLCSEGSLSRPSFKYPSLSTNKVFGSPSTVLRCWERADGKTIYLSHGRLSLGTQFFVVVVATSRVASFAQWRELASLKLFPAVFHSTNRRIRFSICHLYRFIRLFVERAVESNF